MKKWIDDTQVYYIVYVECVISNNKWKTDNKYNELSWLEHIIINDEVCILTTQLGWMEDALDCIIDKFANIKFNKYP